MSHTAQSGFTHELTSTFALVSARDLRIKRIHEEPMPSDGFRVLVDRSWPREISRQRADVDAWLRDLAPSEALQTWFEQDPARWTGFRQRYRAELARKKSLVESIRYRSLDERVTLLFAAGDPSRNHALVLRNFIVAA